MPKENRKFFLVTCIITILPMFLGLFLWNRLPDQIATHFDFNGTPDGYSSKRFAVIGIYVFCLFMHIFCAVVTCLDPKKKNVSPKVYRLILCICPLVSLWCAALIYSNALHAPLHFINWGSLLMGVIFLVTGNYLPKCRQNYTIGIKLPWTLDDEENWNYTHRLAGKLWMIGGVLIILLGFQTVVPSMAVSMTIMVVVTMIPAIASYLYYKKH